MNRLKLAVFIGARPWLASLVGKPWLATFTRSPWLLPLLVGLLLRVVAALVGYGYFASDDYRYALDPAWRSLTHDDLAPASPIRSVVFARFIGLTFRVAWALGARDPTWLVRFAYLVLGLYSALAIPGVYRLTKDRLGEPAARAAAWLMACQALMPRLATRALIEIAAIPPLVWGLAHICAPTRTIITKPVARRWLDRVLPLPRAAAHDDMLRQAVIGGALLGIAAMLRFQVGLVGVTVFVMAVAMRRVRMALGLALGGGAALLAQGLIDLASHGRFLRPLLSYVAFNAKHSSSFGRAPWFTYLVLLLLVTLPPLTLWLVRPLWQAAKRHYVVSACLAVFVVAHSVIPHKEERFVFSVLPLFFVLLAAALVDTRVWVRRTFWMVNAVALVVATLSDGQRNVIDPLRGAMGLTAMTVVGGFEVPELYAGGRRVDRLPDFNALRTSWAERRPVGPTRVIVSASGLPLTLDPMLGMNCGEPQIFSGDLVDRALVAINPKGNARRTPKAAIDCTPLEGM